MILRAQTARQLRLVRGYARELVCELVGLIPLELDPGDEAYLFRDPLTGWAVGACAFSRRPGGWCMAWAYIEPDARRQGHLTRAWPVLRRRYGAFDLQPPLSPAMAAAVRKLSRLELPPPRGAASAAPLRAAPQEHRCRP